MTRNAIATPLGESAVMVTMRRGSRGPWSVIVDEPAEGRDPLGPPPGYLALVGIGSCTVVTVAGVASRGASELFGMQVSFDVVEGAGGFAINQRTTLEADLTEGDHLRLSRAVANCPVGKNFTKRGVTIDDHVVLAGVSPSGYVPDEVELPASVDLAVFAAGHVEVAYLPETREWLDVDGRRVLDQEGEVKAHVDCATSSGDRRRWGYLGGHSSAGWAPRPSAYALGGLAASSLMTLRRLAHLLGIEPASLSVEVEVVSDVPIGGKESSQEAAAGGVAGRVHWRRTVTTTPARPDISAAAVERALRLDPIAGYCERGDLLAGDEIVVAPPRSRAFA